jgi:hypothetical protein
MHLLLGLIAVVLFCPVLYPKFEAPLIVLLFRKQK